MKYVAFILFLILPGAGFAQQPGNLENHLNNHKVSIEKSGNKLELSKNVSAFLNGIMQGKNLLVLSEGNHNLMLNGQMLLLLQENFANRGLKHCFMEDGRATCMLANSSAAIPAANPTYYNAFVEDANLMAKRMHEQNIYEKNRQFTYVGIDYERYWTFYAALASLMQTAESQKVREAYNMSPYLKQTYYYAMKSKGFDEVQERTKREFYKDSAKLKDLLPEQFEAIKYLITNTNKGEKQRDKQMADNVLDKLNTTDKSALYLVDCQFDHGCPSIKNNMADRLITSKGLENKVLVMNVYCDSCAIEDQALAKMGIIKGDVLEAFRHAANSDIVLFDLSMLPDEYQYLSAHGSLLLFARRQNNIPVQSAQNTASNRMLPRQTKAVR